MTPRKGNLMGVRTDIKVLDATIRDGGLCNNFDFSDEFVRELYKTNIKSGVDYMEFGYKASRTLFNEADFGKWKFCKEEDIRAIVGENVSDMKISVMADVGRCDFKTDFLPKSESVIDMVRVACYIHQIPAAIEMIEYFHDLGYETTCNIMAISQPGQDRRIFTFDGSKYMIVFRRSTIISQLIIETCQLIVGIEIHAVGSQYFTITLFSFRYPSEIDRIPGNGIQCIHIVRIHLQAMRKTLIGLLIAQQSLIRLPDCRHCSIIG